VRLIPGRSSQHRERGLARHKTVWAGLAMVFAVAAALMVANWYAAPATTGWTMGPAHASHSVTSAVRST
jgi:hypothetical protein